MARGTASVDRMSKDTRNVVGSNSAEIIQAGVHLHTCWWSVIQWNRDVVLVNTRISGAERRSGVCHTRAGMAKLQHQTIYRYNRPTVLAVVAHQAQVYNSERWPHPHDRCSCWGSSGKSRSTSGCFVRPLVSSRFRMFTAEKLKTYGSVYKFCTVINPYDCRSRKTWASRRNNRGILNYCAVHGVYNSSTWHAAFYVWQIKLQ